VTLSSNVNTVLADITIGGDLTIAENQDIQIATMGGDFTVVGKTTGVIAGEDESLEITAGAGQVVFNDVFGANAGEFASGLTDLTVTSSGSATVGNVDITGELNIVATNFISQLENSAISIGGGTFLTASDITFSNINAQGGLTVNDVQITSDNALNLLGTIGGDLILDIQSTLSANIGAAVKIVLDVNDNVAIINEQSTKIEGMVDGDLSITAVNGTITDTDTLEVSGAGTFDSSGTAAGITLDSAGNVFGSLNLSSSGVAVITEANDTVLDLVDVDSLILNTSGSIDDTGSALIVVSGVAEFSAGGSITLGNDATDLIQLNMTRLNGTDISLVDLRLDGISLGDISGTSLSLTTAGNIVSEANALITVQGNAEIIAANGAADIDLALSNNAFGGIDLVGGVVTIAERDSMQIIQLTAEEYTATVQGDISDFGALNVTGPSEQSHRAEKIDYKPSLVHLSAYQTLEVSGGDE
jgi:hypothetical protein